MVNDIGLIELNGTLTFSPSVSAISLPTDDLSEVNTPVVIAEWGKTNVSGRNISLKYNIFQINNCRKKILISDNLVVFGKIISLHY